MVQVEDGVMDIFELADAIGRNEEYIDTPNMDVFWLDMDVLRSLCIACKDSRFHPLVDEPETLVPCAYQGRTYLMDACANLWYFDTHGFLSPVSVGYYSGVDGVVTDLLEQDDLDPKFREHLQQYLKQPESE